MDIQQSDRENTPQDDPGQGEGRGNGDAIAEAVRRHAELILRAAGSALRNYSVYGSQERILSAVLACYEDAYRAGAERATDAARTAIARARGEKG